MGPAVTPWQTALIVGVIVGCALAALILSLVFSKDRDPAGGWFVDYDGPLPMYASRSRKRPGDELGRFTDAELIAELGQRNPLHDRKGRLARPAVPLHMKGSP